MSHPSLPHSSIVQVASQGRVSDLRAGRLVVLQCHHSLLRAQSALQHSTAQHSLTRHVRALTQSVTQQGLDSISLSSAALAPTSHPGLWPISPWTWRGAGASLAGRQAHTHTHTHMCLFAPWHAYTPVCSWLSSHLQPN